MLKKTWLFLAFALVLLLGAAPALGEGGLYLSGEALNVPGTFAGHTFFLPASALAEMLAARDTTAALGTDIWQEDVFFSSSEDHGEPTWYYHLSDGIFLKDLLAVLGVDEAAQASVSTVKLIAGDGYITAFDGFGQLERYAFRDKRDAQGQPVEAMLAFFTARQAHTAQGLEALAQQPVPGGLAPTFMFGQTEGNDHNNCNYAKYIQCIDLGGAPALAAVIAGGQREVTRYFTTAELMALGGETRTYTVNGSVYEATGINLATLAEALSLAEDAALRFTTLQNGRERVSARRFTAQEAASGQYLLAWYATKSGRPVANDTELRLYGDGLAMAHITGLRCD